MLTQRQDDPLPLAAWLGGASSAHRVEAPPRSTGPYREALARCKAALAEQDAPDAKNGGE
ncbi:MAG: hypothetical protein ACK5Q4_11980 [Phycisphaerae bacterium]